MEIREKIINHIRNLVEHINFSPTVVSTQFRHNESDIPEYTLKMCKLYYLLNGQLLSNKISIEKYVTTLVDLNMGNCGDHAMLLYTILRNDDTLPEDFRHNLKIGKLNPPNDHYFVTSNDIVMDPWLALFKMYSDTSLKEECGVFYTQQGFINVMKTMVDNVHIHDGELKVDCCSNNTRFLRNNFGRIKAVLPVTLLNFQLFANLLE